MKISALITVLLIAVFAVDAQDTLLYKEKYRPQYHFTPAHRWIGDPCGLLKHNGKYMGYSWGAAETSDLVHWRELNQLAIKGLPKGIAPFTGSVVVDSLNSAGYGKDALIAVFTSFDEETKIQAQSIAVSNDGGLSFQYYEGNPVLDIGSTEFRDPTVVWDARNRRWVMLVAKALEKKIAFYGSPDLKNWEWLSDFGPLGDSARSWECPDLFRLPVEGTDEWKWVLLVSVNWAREQYFVGDFNGTEFIAEQPEAYPLYVDDGMDYYASRVFMDFDSDSAKVYTLGWVNTWDYAPQAPSAWGKGVWSLPRELSLKKTDGVYTLCQKPAESFEQLRGQPFVFSGKVTSGVTAVPELSAMGNCYEMLLDVHSPEPDVWWINLCCGDGRKVTVGYDTASGYLKIDRTNCTDADMPECFNRISFARVQSVDGTVSLRVFMDKSTMEIFTPAGNRTFTLLTYPAENQVGVELFSLSGTSDFKMTVYPMTSIRKQGAHTLDS